MVEMSEAPSEIQRFFDGQNVFITGGTGFMGKILVEKLLRTCSGLKKVYMLVRPTKNMDVKERLEKFTQQSVFSVLANQQPNFQEKMVAIQGDCSESRLGISEEDRELLKREVSIVFHMAATTRFDEPLPVAIQLNAVSVKDVIELCKECKNFKAGVYVSTAYSNCIRSRVEETVYDPPMEVEDAFTLSQILNKRNLSPKELKAVTKQMIGNYPNTYTYTKAIAESVVAKYAKDMPFSIIRPSIVISTNKEPVPAWTDNLLGPCGIMAGIGLGVLHCILVDVTKQVNLIPCDMACQAIVAAAWETGVKHRKPEEPIPVYNYVNRKANTWEYLRNQGISTFTSRPSIHVVYWPCVIPVTSVSVYLFLQFFLCCIPAVILDMIARFRGQKAVMYKVYKVGIKHSIMMRFFAIQEWDFANEHTVALFENMSARDKELFPFSFESFEWNEYLPVFVDSMKNMYEDKMLKNKSFTPVQDDSLENARKHMRKLYIIHLCVKTVFFLLTLWMLYVVFKGALLVISKIA